MEVLRSRSSHGSGKGMLRVRALRVIWALAQFKVVGLLIWEFPKIRGTFLGVPIIRTLVFWGLYWGPLILGNYHFFQKTTAARGCEIDLSESTASGAPQLLVTL